MNLPPLPEELGCVAPFLHEFAAPCIALSLTKGRSEAIDRSKFGGNAHLPGSFEWPANEKRRLDFLLQINLLEVAPFDPSRSIPKTGLLSFFYDLKNTPWNPTPGEGFRVIYTPPNAELRPYSAPDRGVALREFDISFRPSLSLPYFSSRAFSRLQERMQKSAAKPFSDDEMNDFADSYSDYFHELNHTDDPNPEGGSHRMLGHAENIQNDMQEEIISANVIPGSTESDWLLLLQLDSDETGEFMWEDAGMLYFWVHKADLTDHRFDRVWMSLQCC